MQPEARLVALSLGNQAPEFGGPAFAVFAVAEALIEEPGKGEDNGREIEKVQQVGDRQSFAFVGCMAGQRPAPRYAIMLPPLRRQQFLYFLPLPQGQG